MRHLEARTVKYYSNQIDYYLTRKKIKNFNMRLRADNNIFVSAPLKCKLEDIDNFVISKINWILKVRKREDTRLKPYEKIENGALLQLWGQICTMQFIKGCYMQSHRQQNIVYLYTADTETLTSRKKALDKFLLAQAQEFFPSEFKNTCVAMEHHPIPILSIRRMKSRWGSARPAKNSITLNLNLVHYRPHILRMVIVHEFLHFKIISHNKKFYEQLAYYVPNWQDYKKELKNLNV